MTRDTSFIRVKQTSQYLHHTWGYACRYVLLAPNTKQKLWVMGDASFFCTDRGEEPARLDCIPWHHLITQIGRQLGTMRSNRQDLIAKSTVEAELIASSEALNSAGRENSHYGCRDDQPLM